MSLGSRSRRCWGGIAALWLAAALPAQSHNVLRAGNGPEPETLDPHKSEGVSAANILRDLYEGLCSVAPDGRIVPGAAERWSVSADGRVYTFELRTQAKWSNGEPVTAADFVAGLRRSVDPATGSSYSQVLAPIENAEEILARRLPPEALGVDALGEHRLRIRLRAPAPYLLGLLTHATTYPIHRPSLARYGSGFARPGRLVSNGAYRLHDWVVQSQVTLRRNPYYRDNAHTQIDEVVYIPTENQDSELKRYQAGELDYTYEIPLVRAPEIRRQFGPELRIAAYSGTYYYGFNLTRPPFKDNRALRQALSMAVDRELIVRKLMHGVALPAWGWVPPGTWNYTPQRPHWADWPAPRRLAEARRLYAAAGYSEDRPLEVELRYNTHDDHKRIALVIAAMWKQHLGVRTRLVNEEFKVFLNNRKLRAVTEVFRGSWIADYDDASSFADVLHSSNGQNDPGYANPDYDALLAAAARESDPRRRRALLEQAERLMLADVPLLPVYFYVSKHLVKPWVQGWQDNLLDYHYSKDLWLLPH
jgi:oligopeptide transport system substrate-binding protein